MATLVADDAAAYLPYLLAAQELSAACRHRWTSALFSEDAHPDAPRKQKESTGGGAADGDVVWLYQLEDGQCAFLHPLNVKCLMAECEQGERSEPQEQEEEEQQQEEQDDSQDQHSQQQQQQQ